VGEIGLDVLKLLSLLFQVGKWVSLYGLWIKYLEHPNAVSGECGQLASGCGIQLF
jgi:hypothetical protein